MAKMELDIFSVEKLQANSNPVVSPGQSESISPNHVGNPALSQTGKARRRAGLAIISLVFNGLAFTRLSLTRLPGEDDRGNLLFADHLVIGWNVITQYLL